MTERFTESEMNSAGVVSPNSVAAGGTDVMSAIRYRRMVEGLTRLGGCILGGILRKCSPEGPRPKPKLQQLP